MTDIWLCLVLGRVAGIVSAMTRAGAQTHILPSVIDLLGCSQHQAQGTTLAPLVPALID